MQINTKKVKVGAAAVGGVAVLSALGIFGIQAASAASDSNSTTVTAQQNHQGAPADGRGGRPGAFRGGPGGGETVHGEMVVKDGDSYKTMQMQSGVVTEIGANSVTVKSDDGFTATYSIDDNTKVMKDGAQATVADLSSGDKVHLGGAKADGSITADHIMAGDPPARPSGGPRGGAPEGLEG